MPVIVPSVSKIIQRIVFNKLYIETLQHYVKSLTKKKKGKKFLSWRIWVSIPVLPACEAGALPFELIPHSRTLVGGKRS